MRSRDTRQGNRLPDCRSFRDLELDERLALGRRADHLDRERRAAGLRIDLPGSFHECIHQRGRNMIENGADQFFQDPVGVLVVQAQLDLAPVTAKLRESPGPVQPAEWPLQQPDAAYSTGSCLAFSVVKLSQIPW